MIGTKQQVDTYLEKDKEWDIYEIKRKNKKTVRTLSQVKYYWGVIVKIISEHHWYTPIETNEMLKVTFAVDTFTNLDTKEFVFVIDTIIELWKTKYNVIIPLPNDIEWDNSLYNSLWF